MLLLIALANVPIYLAAQERSSVGAHPLDGSSLDRAVQAVMLVAVDLRVYPMFALLFGYGLVLSTRRQQLGGATEREARRSLVWRNLALIVLGAAHAALLWAGDILAAYGLCGLVIVTLFLRRSDLTLLIAAALGTLALVALSAASVAALVATGGEPGAAGTRVDGLITSVTTDSLGGAVVARLTFWPVQTLVAQGPLGITVPVAMLLGVLAARHRLLERPERHRPLLLCVALAGVAAGWIGGLPLALTHTGVVSGLEGSMWAFDWPHKLTGLLCGVGYVAAFALLGERLSRRRPGFLTTAVAAVGQRSLSCYLAQSVICAPILAAWGLGLGTKLSSTSAALFAGLVWLITLTWAVTLSRRGIPGPAEQLLRRARPSPARPRL